MIPIKSTDRTLVELQDLERLLAKLFETARKLPAGRYATISLRRSGNSVRGSPH
jgi:hypothetical protein